MRHLQGNFVPKNIVFLEPKARDPHTFSGLPIPRVGCVELATMARDWRGKNVRVLVEEVASFNPEVVLGDDVDMVCISTLTNTAPEAYEWANLCALAGKPVVLGGVHATFLPNESLYHAPLVIRGEAEESFLDLLDCLAAGDDLFKVRGLSWKDGLGHHFHNPPTDPLEMVPSSEFLNTIPVPDFSLVEGYQLKKPAAIPIATIRGCPHMCTFCSVTAFNGRRYRHPSVLWVLNALEKYIKDFGNVRWFFFVADNFIAHPKWAEELMLGIIERQLNISWGAQFTIHFTKNERLMELAVKAGLDRAFLGYESPIDKSLADCHKSQTTAQIEEAQKKLKEFDIPDHGMYMIFPSDPSDIASRIVDFAERNSNDTIQIIPLGANPGSELWTTLQTSREQLLSQDWRLFNGQQPLLIPKNMSPLKQHQTTATALSRFYRPTKIWQSFFAYLKTRDIKQLKTMMIRLKGWQLTKLIKWSKSNRLFLKFLRSHPETTGETYESWELKRRLARRITIRCPQNLRQTVSSFLAELGFSKVRVKPIKHKPNLSGQKIGEIRISLSNWLRKQKAHFVVSDLSEIGDDWRERFADIVNRWPKFRKQSKLICLPRTSENNTIKNMLRRLGAYLSSNEETIESAIKKIPLKD
ncbi:MAG: radical SAM protein [bacterium]